MSGLIRLADGIAILELPAGPEGYLTGEMCRDVLRALEDLAGRLERGETDAAGLVLRGAGQEFCRGFDPVAEEGDAAREALAALCAGIEAYPCPTVACLDGLVSGAGVALALAAHGRVATREARLICPEVGYGLMPGGGSTQRLPRLVGADTALQMMLEGRLHRAGDPALAAVIDRIEDEDPLAQAIKLAKSLAPSRRTSLREDGLRQPAAYFAALAAHRAQSHAPVAAAAQAVLRAVEAAALLPFERGVALEEVLAQDLARDAEARAARYRARLAHVARALARDEALPNEAAATWIRQGYWAIGRSLLVRGARPEAIDASARRIGFATGPFAMMETRSGEDIVREFDAFARASGWRVPASGFAQASLDEALLGGIIHAGMVNVCVAAQAAGVLQHTMEADVIAARDLGFEAAKGGLLFQAEEQGLLPLLRALQGLRAETASVLAPVPEFSRMVNEGRRLFDDVTPRNASLAGA
ncbi:enoyl-CoA hydratase/isomerase family protein [Roseovarius nubinhibens]|uniref:3-hydroxyacyl-CoA dehydrogenase n=1 Tax=Roseovarius nubinhibens TaxID=314263 RepID=A0A348W874_9RHOB|nr:hypothetical protein [Roseovarius nubinhibens]